MNVFDLDRAIVSDYERFARSLTQIRAPDIRSELEAIYANDRFWPEPLISLNPHYERGSSISELVMPTVRAVLFRGIGNLVGSFGPR